MKQKHFSVAIDGPGGAGKSTLARRAAETLGFRYVDTGAIYRTVGYHMALMGIGPRDADGIKRLIDDVNVEIHYSEDGKQHMILNGVDVTAEIRTPEMDRYASGVSAQPCVRKYLLQMQRDLAKQYDVIMDGRDIATVVLPNADVKVFLTATSEARARRRYEQLIRKKETVTYEKVLADMIARDKQDSERDAAPLKCAADAVLLDTTELDEAQSLSALLQIIESKYHK